MRIRIANLSPYRWTGWARGTTDADLPPVSHASQPDGTDILIVRGPKSGLETNIIDVHTQLDPGAEVVVNSVEELTEQFPRALPSDALTYFGGALLINGEAADFVLPPTQDGAGWSCELRRRIGNFDVRVWLTYYPDQPWAPAEVMVTCSNPTTVDLTSVAPEITVRFGDAVVHPLGLNPGAPIVQAGEVFADGQARVVPVTMTWLRHMTQPDEFASSLAAQSHAISVMGCERSFADGNVSFPVDFSAKAWAGQNWNRAVSLIHNWEPGPLGWAPDSGQTGAQEDQCFTGVEALLPDGAGCEQVNYFAALELANRPCHHVEVDGRIVDKANRPNLRMFYSRPHRSGSDMLGKFRDLTVAEARGWNGPDAQHWFFSRLAMAARFTGKRSCQRLLEHQAHNYLIQLTTTPGWPTSAIWSAREIGWEGIAVVHLWRELADRALAERVRAHWHARASWIASQLPEPVGRPWDVRINDDRLGPGEWWMPWQQSIGAYGILLAYRHLGGPVALRDKAVAAAYQVLDCWRKEGDRWVEYELAALDGGMQRSGMFTTSWMPLAIAVVLWDESQHPKARSIWAQMKADAGGNGKWMAPGVA